MTNEKPTWVLSELARNPKLDLNEEVILARKCAEKERKSLDLIIGESPSSQGLFMVVEDYTGCSVHPAHKEAPLIHTSLEEASEEALRVNDYYETGKRYNPAVFVMQLCELIENREQCQLKKGKIIRPKIKFFPQDPLTKEKVSTYGQFAGVIYRINYSRSIFTNEPEPWNDFYFVNGNFNTIVKDIMDLEEDFGLDKHSPYPCGNSLVYFGKIVASV